jgi:hypothetical protein
VPIVSLLQLKLIKAKRRFVPPLLLENLGLGIEEETRAKDDHIVEVDDIEEDSMVDDQFES